jgi:hypothetical protein
MKTRCYFCHARDAAGGTFFPLCGACAERVAALAAAGAMDARRDGSDADGDGVWGRPKIEAGTTNALPATAGRG